MVRYHPMTDKDFAHEIHYCQSRYDFVDHISTYDSGAIEVFLNPTLAAVLPTALQTIRMRRSEFTRKALLAAYQGQVVEWLQTQYQLAEKLYQQARGLG